MLQPNSERIARFMADDVMVESVHDVLLASFMKKRDGDVNLKAAQMIALELLQEGWKELAKHKGRGEQERPVVRQVGR